MTRENRPVRKSLMAAITVALFPAMAFGQAMPEAGEELTLGRFGFRVARADARRLHALHVSVHADHPQE